jgi:recombinational DNA repair protein (RecF pathway)
MQQPKIEPDRSAYDQSVDRFVCAMLGMLGIRPAQDDNAASGEPETEASQDGDEKSTWPA